MQGMARPTTSWSSYPRVLDHSPLLSMKPSLLCQPSRSSKAFHLSRTVPFSLTSPSCPTRYVVTIDTRLWPDPSFHPPGELSAGHWWAAQAAHRLNQLVLFWLPDPWLCGGPPHRQQFQISWWSEVVSVRWGSLIWAQHTARRLSGTVPSSHPNARHAGHPPSIT